MSHEQQDAAPLLGEVHGAIANDGRPDRQEARHGREEVEHEVTRHIRGWLMASWASEVYAIVALTCFSPLVLEAFGKSNGVLAIDGRTPCSLALRCVIPALANIDTVSFALYVYSASVALQALTVISLGAKIDTPRSRWQCFVNASLAGSIATTAILFLSDESPLWLFIALFVLVGNVAFGVVVVCLNAFLPVLVHDARAMARLSTRGLALGYASGISGLLISLVPVTLLRGSTLSMRTAISGAGIWWLVSTIFAARWLPSGEGDATRRTLGDGWRALGQLFVEARALGEALKYLAAFALMSDGFATITSVAILFGRTELGMSPQKLILVAIITPVSGILGALAWNRFAGLNALQSVTALVLLALLLPAYGLLGLLPIFDTPDAPPFGGLRHEGELYVLAVAFGALYGPWQAQSRATFAMMIPASRSGSFFSLYSISDKSTSFLGPLLVGMVTNWTGEIRGGFAVIAALLLLTLPVLLSVDLTIGRQQAGR